jgi:hypothetical protein
MDKMAEVMIARAARETNTPLHEWREVSPDDAPDGVVTLENEVREVEAYFRVRNGSGPVLCGIRSTVALGGAR